MRNEVAAKDSAGFELVKKSVFVDFAFEYHEKLVSFHAFG
jgi:hypothetical protein